MPRLADTIVRFQAVKVTTTMLLFFFVACGDDTEVGPQQNSVPVANDLTVQTSEDTPVSIVLSATDADGNNLTFAIQAEPENGVLSGDAPNLTYTPVMDFSGSDSLTFWASDGMDTSDVGTVLIEVGAVNDPPVASAGPDQSTGVLFTVTLDGSQSDDPEGSSLTYVWTQTTGTQVSLSDASVAQPFFNAPAGPGSVTFALVVTDDSLATSVADEVIITLQTWAAIEAGPEYSLAIRSDGTLWGWGLNISVLGRTFSEMNQASLPIQIGAESDWNTVAGGKDFVASLKDNGTLWAWGSNQSGQLGQGAAGAEPVIAATQIGIASDWVAVDAGKQFAVALKSDGTLWSWGSNDKGQLGVGGNSLRSSPTQVGTDTNWISIAAGEQHTLAIKSDSSLWGWGYNIGGQFADGTQLDRSSPDRVATGTQWTKAGSGGENCGGIRADGSLWAWGNSVNGLGMIQKGTTQNWLGVFTGSSHSLMLNLSNEAWAWGSNPNGQLGDGSLNSSADPIQVSPGSAWMSLSAGGLKGFTGTHSLGIQSDGSLWSWGSNADGRLGIGTDDINPHPDPVPVGQLSP